MKIKDCVVINKESLNTIINELTNEIPEYILNMLSESVKPLEPIVRDAFNNGDYLYQLNEDDFQFYLNETEL